MLFGFGPSSYICTRLYYWGEEIIRGDKKLEGNQFRWDKLIMNLPGDISYDSTMPWVYKWDSLAKLIVTDFVTFMDDTRVVGGNEPRCTGGMYRIATLTHYLGEQNTIRNWRYASQPPGLWIGGSMDTDNENIYVSTSQEK